MTRSKREGASVTLDPDSALKFIDGLGVSPRPCCSPAFKAGGKRETTKSGGKITVTC